MDGPDKQGRDEAAHARADPARKIACLYRRFQFGQIPVLMLPAADLQNILFSIKDPPLPSFLVIMITPPSFLVNLFRQNFGGLPIAD